MVMVVLQGLSAVFAGLAAILWLVSAAVKTPTSFAISVVLPTGPPLGGNPLGGT